MGKIKRDSLAWYCKHIIPASWRQSQEYCKAGQFSDSNRMYQVKKRNEDAQDRSVQRP